MGTRVRWRPRYLPGWCYPVVLFPHCGGLAAFAETASGFRLGSHLGFLSAPPQMKIHWTQTSGGSKRGLDRFLPSEEG